MAETSGRRPHWQFTDEFKQQAVRLVLDEGDSVTAWRATWISSDRGQLGQAGAGRRSNGRTGLATTGREDLARPRAARALAATFAIIAVVAAAGCFFSVLSYAVSRRRREFGIRTALGASPRRSAD